MIRAEPFRTVVRTCQIDELAADVKGGQAKEIGQRLRRDCRQRLPESQRRILADIAGIFPAADAGIVAQHLARQAGQAIASAVDQLVARGHIARLKTFEPALHEGE